MKSKGMLIPFSVVLGYICLLTKACIWSTRTMDFVQSCPSTKEETDKRSGIRRCGALAYRQNCTEPIQFKYHCLYNYLQKKLVELCAEDTYFHGVCTVFDENTRQIQPVYNVKCGNKSWPCPETFSSSTGHLYAPCPGLLYLKVFDMKGSSNNSQLPVNESQNLWFLAVLIPIFVIMIVSGILIIIFYKRRKRSFTKGDNKRRNLRVHFPLIADNQRNKPSHLNSQKCSTGERKTKNKEEEKRECHTEYFKKETQTVHNARGMIVGCAGAGKTTFLKRLLGYSEEEINNVNSTEGLELYEDIIEICDETKSLKVMDQVNSGTKRPDNTKSKSYAKNVAKKTLTFFDFGGHPVYYASHQIFLNKKAFYIVVVDASKCLEQEVDKNVCDQTGSVCLGWTYGDYFAFWIQSIHTLWACCSEQEEDQKPTVLIVATHWEEGKKLYKDKFGLLYALKQRLRGSSNLSQYIRTDNTFCTERCVPLSKDLEDCIFDIASEQRWKENIPMEWSEFEIEINQKKHKVRILDSQKVTTKFPEADIEQEKNKSGKGTKIDMFQFYHDAGKILFFNEKDLDEHIVLDVQWFIDALKHIISNKLHLGAVEAVQSDWDEFYNTGVLPDRLLSEIWRCIDVRLYEKLKENQGDDSEIKNHMYDFDTRCLLYHKKCLLKFIEKIGLFALGQDSYYIPCMNRRDTNEELQYFIKNATDKSSILIYQYPFVPYFLFFRLVVACMQVENWKILENGGTYCLYKNAALFSYMNDFFVVSVTTETIQLQVFSTVCGHVLKKPATCSIQRTIENILSDLTGTYGRKACFVRGFRCRIDKENTVAVDIKNHFVSEKYFAQGDSNFNCPLHTITDQHVIYANDLTRYWKLKRKN